MKSKVSSSMEITPAVAMRTLEYLRRIIPRGHAEADSLLSLIVFFEQIAQQGHRKRSK